MKGGLDGGHDEGCLLDHSQEFALDDRGFPDSSSSQAGKHDGPHWLSGTGAKSVHFCLIMF